jgi:hypothetical protein
MLSYNRNNSIEPSIYHFTEKKPYSTSILEDKKVPIKKWVEKGWLKEISKQPESFSFIFVGFLSHEKTFFFIFPSWGQQIPNSDESVLIMKTIHKALSHSSEYIRSDEVIGEQVQFNSQPSDLLISWLNFIDDYEVYGELREEYTRIGDIGNRLDWAATFQRKIPLITNQGPLFLEPLYRSNRRISSEVTKIHLLLISYVQSVLGRFIPEYSWATNQLIEPPDYSSSLDVVRRALKKRTTEYFHTRLVLLEDVLKNLNTVDTSEDMTLGVSKFDDVWEKTCLEVFGSKQLLNEVIKQIPRRRFISVEGVGEEKGGRHKPDAIEHDPDNNQKVIIMDAKNHRNFKDIGLEEVTKQYAYEKAVISITNQDLGGLQIPKYGVSRNMLLFPSHTQIDQGCLKWGTVDVSYLSAGDVKPIEIMLIDPVALMESYVYGKGRIELKNQLLSVD